MRTFPIVLGLALYGLSGGTATVACSQSCFRHTDCSKGARCIDGVCIVFVERAPADAASVEPLTVEMAVLASEAPPDAGTAPDEPIRDGG